MFIRFLLPSLLTLALSTGALAAPLAQVEGLRMPVWLDRGTSRQPLKAGLELKAGDKLHTGAEARVMMRMADGSTVKLGENATFTLAAVAKGPDPATKQADSVAQNRWGAAAGSNETFSATIDVLKGAFRFTTAQVAKIRKRAVTIHIAGLTAGIRGTDVWGKAFNDKNLLCLIEGRVDVQDGSKLFTMLDPLSFYVTKKDGSADPVSRVDPNKLKEWAQETEITPGQGAATISGKWKITLASPQSEKDALALYDKLRTAGYAAEINPVKLKGKQHYRVRIAQLPSREEANALALRIQGKFVPEKPWASLE